MTVLPRLIVVATLSAALVTGNAVSPGLSAATAAATAATDRVVISDGHVDMGPRIVDGTWRVQLRDDTQSPSVWRDIDSVVLHGSEATRITVPSGDAYSFLGETGSEVYVFPQTQRAGVVWPGWNTQDPSVVDGVTGDITWTVQSVDGPGDFHLFLSDSFGNPSLIFDGGKPYPQSTRIDPNTHVHGSWAFSKAGVYQVHMQMSATSTQGQALTDSQTLYLAVATSADGIPAGTGQSGLAEDAGGDTSTSTGSGSGSSASNSASAVDSPDVASGELPNTGAGYLIPMTVAGFAALLGGIALRRVGRRTHHQKH
ncbi:TIGR03773 family transporter-associated surface protein [Kineosporia sp. J2-2]|uniref:TIGR03773 family transporter-associated surface protein n=1 Tax=Kineosporia corallincola TaxID=2835133 RepID=A0ABS5TT89_9ACTN|nr:TIGR03773 family transporter-associated surface protein [Kineosporia corallincola]MBT0774034.1 TIGR03773 family transporter-associated surface protein [Kineosporia corallincola]